MRIVLPTLLVVFGCLRPAFADDERTFLGKPVEYWVAVVRDKTGASRERANAMWVLGCFGEEASTAVPDLIDELRQGRLKDEALAALVRINAGSDVTVPVLIDQFVRQGCEHLTGMGTYVINSRVKDSLVKIGGPAVPALVRILDGPNAGMRVCAADALGKFGPAARAAVPSLIRAIEPHDDDHDTGVLGSTSIRTLGQIGPDAKDAIPILYALLDKEKYGKHFELVIALDRIGLPPVRKLLDAFLRDGDSLTARELAWIGPKRAKEAVPALRAALTEKRPQVPVSAAVTLAYLDPSASEAIPVLIDALKHQNEDDLDVFGVPRALARFGPAAKAAIAPLIGLLSKDFGDAEIFEALVRIDPDGKECVPALVSTLHHEDHYVVCVAADCLGSLGSRAKDAVPALAAAVTRDFNEVFYNGYQPQVSAAKALRRIGPEARSAIPALIAALKYRHVFRPRPGSREAEAGEADAPDCSAAEAAAEVIGSFGSDADAAVPALIEAVQAHDKDDANWPVRKAAILALGQIGPAAMAAIPVLRELLNEKETFDSSNPEAAIALAQLAPDGKELAEKWLAKSATYPIDLGTGFGLFGLERRVMVLGALGRTSAEADWLTRDRLDRMDSILRGANPREDVIESLEWLFEKIGRFGLAGRAAIPRMKEFQNHTNPLVRMWATETLERITPRN